MKRIKVLSILLITNFIFCNASVIINEIMTKNISNHINSNFNFEAWIELYNNGNEDEDISTIFISDDSKNLFKWQMPYDSTINDSEYILPPKSYKIIYMDKLDEAFHANFKLDANGGTLYLTNGEGNISDIFVYKQSYRNSSIGRKDLNNNEIVLFSNPTPNSSNDTTSIIIDQTQNPQFSHQPGFYNESLSIEIACQDSTAKIFYTIDGSEPYPLDSLQYTKPISITKNTPLRAIAISKGKHPSDVVTGSYFFETRKINLPVISLVTDDDYLYGDSLGFLVVGKNGAKVHSGCNAGIPYANYMQDWDRPCNFEYFDLEKNEQMNQEVKIGGFGGCSRTNKTKSIKIKANKTFGNNRLEYPIFKEKPHLKWKSIVLRNSGNDYGSTMLRDGYIQSTLVGRMDIDHQAYEPATVYINGDYYGMLNIRERSNEDFIFSNYGLDEEEIFMHNGSGKYDKSQPDSDYPKMYDYFVNAENMNADGMYDSICAYVDVEELLNYLTAQIYLCNRDWPSNNIKAWKKKSNGKWRWILYDTDFGFSLYENNNNTNSYNYAKSNPLFAAFLKNDLFKFRLMTKMIVHLPTTFSEKRLLNHLDSIVSIVNSELKYFQQTKYAAGDYYRGMSQIKSFAKNRSKGLFGITSTGLNYNDSCALNILTETPKVEYIINHFEKADISNLYCYYFENLPLSVKPITPPGYKFVRWEITEREPFYSKAYTWKCFDTGEIYDHNWKNLDFDDSKWRGVTGKSGYGYDNVSSFINPKEENSENYVQTVYFRYDLNIKDTTNFGEVTLSATVNDAVIVYLNGKEIIRENLPLGDVSYNTKPNSNYGATTKTYKITLPASQFKNGKNVIAAEVHNYSQSSYTLYFNMDIMTSQKDIIHESICNDELFYDENFYGGTLKAVFEKNTDESNPIDEEKLYLNEICISNSTFIDEARESDDWIEIYNDGLESVNLAGYFLSDARKNLTKFQIPSTDSIATTIPAKGYKVFWADSQPEQGPLHTNFSLPTSRTQTVSLSKIVNGDTLVIDSICYKIHEKGESFARIANNKTEASWEVTSRPTFNMMNPIVSEVPTVYIDEHSAFVYPNPVHDELFISTPHDNCHLVIYDVSGRILIEKEVKDKSQIDVTSLKKGLYLLKIMGNSFRYTTKIIKD